LLFMTKKETTKFDLFKALGHPTRRHILKYIARNGSASYSELTEIEPKSGVLYHHLRLLGNLIYQDNNKLYRLTDAGYKAVEFLDTMFLEPHEKSIHAVLTPRPIIERIEGSKFATLFLVAFFLSSLLWYNVREYVPLFLFIAPLETTDYLPLVFIYASWFFSSIMLSVIVKLAYQRYCSYSDLLLKSIPAFLLINLFPIVLYITDNVIVFIATYFLIQIFALLYVIATVSVVARITLRRSALAVISLHYISIMVYLVFSQIGL